MFHNTIRTRFAPECTPRLRIRRADDETAVLDGANRSALIRVR